MNDVTDLNINDLKQLSQLMSNNQTKPIQQTQEPLKKILKKVKIQSPVVSESSDIAQQKIPKQISDKTPAESTQNLDISHNFELMGYVVNKETIYLLIILILMGVGIWFMTADKSKKKEKMKNDDNENDDN